MLIPASSAQDWISLAPAVSSELSSSSCPASPPTISISITAPAATIASRTIAAPMPRGTRCRASQATSGEATAAMIEAVRTGITIVLVSASSQTIPARNSRNPISSQEAMPRSRSQSGARNRPLSSLGSISITGSGAGPASGAASASLSRPSPRSRARIIRGLIAAAYSHRLTGALSSEQLQILPLCLIMVMGPQILTAIFLVTSKEAVKNSLAMIVGVTLAASLGLVIWSVVVRAVGLEAPDSDSPSTADYIVAGLLAVLALRVWMTRGEAEVPKWMSALQEADPRKAFTLGFLLILLMPTDIAATISTANLMNESGLDAIDGWPLVAGTVLLMSLPFLAYMALGRRAREAMPRIKDWLTTHSWLVNLVVIIYFIYSILS